MIAITRACGLVLCAALAGCSTELRLHRAGEPSSNGVVEMQRPHTGIPYPLMYTVFDLLITHRVAGCKAGQYQVISTVELKEQLSAPDPENLFLIDPHSLAGPFKSASVNVTYLPNGAVGSLNATADDKSGAVISNVVTGLIKTALIGYAPVAPAAPGAMTAKRCPGGATAVEEALEAFAKVEPILVQQTGELETATNALKDVIDKMTAMGANVDEATKTAYAAAIDRLGMAQQAIASTRKKAAQATRTLTITRQVRFPRNARERTGLDAPSFAELAKWPGIASESLPDATAVAGTPIQNTSVLAVGFLLERAYPDVPARPSASSIDAEHGLPYRLPEPGRLKACDGACGATTTVYLESRAPVLQLGSVLYLSCRSPAFTSASCSIAYGDGGELKSMGAVLPASSAEAVSAIFKDTATQYAAYRDARSASEKAEEEAAAAVSTGTAGTASAAALEAADTKVAATLSAAAAQDDAEAGQALATMAVVANAERALLKSVITLNQAKAVSR